MAKMNINLKKALGGTAVFGAVSLPAIAGAQTLDTVITTVGDLLNIVVPIIITLAVIFFFWGLAQYILNAGNEEKKAEGRNIMIYGIVALFVIIAVWGLVQVLINTFLGGSTPANPAVIPGVQ